MPILIGDFPGVSVTTLETLHLCYKLLLAKEASKSGFRDKIKHYMRQSDYAFRGVSMIGLQNLAIADPIHINQRANHTD
jgi:hypothetical protein